MFITSIVDALRLTVMEEQKDNCRNLKHTGENQTPVIFVKYADCSAKAKTQIKCYPVKS